MSKNKNALSPKEQDIYFAISNSKNRLFTIEMIRGLGIDSGAALRASLAGMVKKGWLIRIKRGTYYLREAGKGGIEDIFKIATYMYNGYIAFSSALYLYNAMTERPYTVYVATRTTSGSGTVGQMEIRAVALKRRAMGMTEYEGYKISTRAKTIYDCFHMSEYAGGYSKVIEAVHAMDLNADEWKEFMRYVASFESDSSKRKIGYMLELANKAGSGVPDAVIRSLKRKGPVVKLGKGLNGRYIKGWGIVDYLGEGYLLGWSR
ncbi:MAG: type IV toxin-antitoxin system AbiEi family antitoxin domain-containing protein [Candidatus Micrarchaeaceae archaeon]